jgi:hypothetical protein
MCKASHEPGGPQRCSGDARQNYQHSTESVTTLEKRLADVTAELAAGGGELFDELLAARSEIRREFNKGYALDGDKVLPSEFISDFAATSGDAVRAIDRLLEKPQDQWTEDDSQAASQIGGVATQMRRTAAENSIPWDEWARQARAAGLDEESLAVYRRHHDAGKSALMKALADRSSPKSMTWDQWSAQATAAGLDDKTFALYRRRYEAGQTQFFFEGPQAGA